ncbi:MAG: phenylalanine--tRNA ligase subunit beta [bacterium]|nr:phenylalanine--tRNA ligase subunit beta [bacterium]
MQFSYNWLQSFFPAKGGQEKKPALPARFAESRRAGRFPSSEKLAEVLTMHSFEVKGIKPITLPSGMNDIILDIDVLPNRAHDCFCHRGIAKEISALFNLPLKIFPKPMVRRRSPSALSEVEVPKLETVKKPAAEFLKLEVEEPALCRRYIAAVMLDIKVGVSPSWIQDRLIAVGQKPINSIVDAANYVMFELGQPLHAFDMDKLNPAHIIVRRAKPGERIITLDNKEYSLDKNTLVIADSYEPLAIAGIKGGKKAEIDRKTKNIIIESANFEPTNVRLTSQKLGLRTGASVGFENEISVFLAEQAIERVIELIHEIGGGKVVGEKIDFYPVKSKTPAISFRTSDISKLLGIAVSEKEIISILKRLGIGFKKVKGALIAISPAERLDLKIKEDIAEEIARIHGYEKIPSKIPEGFLVPASRNNKYFYENVIRDIFVGAGFSEVYNYSFAATGEAEIENPISEDKKFLRTNLLDGFKDNVRKNFKYFDEVRIFEIGKVFKKEGKNIAEKNMLAGVVAYKKPKVKNEGFYEMKGVLEMLFSQLGISDFWFDDVPADLSTEARRAEAEALAKAGSPTLAEIKVSSESVGYMDENAFEINLEKLIELADEEFEYRPVSKYPAVIRDIAIFVSQNTKVVEVLDVIENTAGNLLIDTDLFDIYEPETAGENKKSLAFHLIFQSREKTLNDKEVNALMDKIIKALEEKDDWEVRK